MTEPTSPPVSNFPLARDNADLGAIFYPLWPEPSVTIWGMQHHFLGPGLIKENPNHNSSPESFLKLPGDRQSFWNPNRASPPAIVGVEPLRIMWARKKGLRRLQPAPAARGAYVINMDEVHFTHTTLDGGC